MKDKDDQINIMGQVAFVCTALEGLAPIMKIKKIDPIVYYGVMYVVTAKLRKKLMEGGILKGEVDAVEKEVLNCLDP